MARMGRLAPKYHRQGHAEVLEVPLPVCISWAKRLSGLVALAVCAWLVLERSHDARVALQAAPQPAEPRALSAEAGGKAAGEGSDCSTLGHGRAINSLEGTLCFLVTCCLLCCVLDHWNGAVPAAWRLPISVVIFITGMVAGVIFLKVLDGAEAWGSGADVVIAGMQGASYLDPHAVFYVLLPPLLYESASSMSWHVLRKVLPSAVLLAVPGVALNTILVGSFARWALHVPGYGEMTWEASLLLASVLSATDPVAVVAALHSLGAPKKLATLIEGESLLNDGSAVVFFGVFLDTVATGAPDSTKQCPGIPPAGGCVLLYFLRLALGGPALGAAVGCILFVWINWARARESPVLEIAVVLTSVYGAFLLAELLHVSGVLAVVTLGILVTASVHTRMSHEGRHTHHVVLAQISYACNHVIFFSAGIISARFMWTANECICLYQSPAAWLELLLLYLCLHVMRALVIALFSPMLTRLGYGITWKEGAVLVWGGLRGAVGLAMGLMVEHQDFVDGRISATVVFHVSGIVLLTLIVNGMTVDNLYRRLQLYPPNPFSMTYLRKSLCILEAECGKAILERMLDDWFFQDIDFESILSCVPNFSRISFNAARVPYPDGIQSVKETLHSLEAGATRFKFDLRQRQTKLFLHSPSAACHSAWDTLKDSEASQLLENLWEVTSSGSGKDHVVNVVNTGDQHFEYRAADSSVSSSHGLYVSVRPLSSLPVSGEEGRHGFSVRVLSMDGAHVVVGLVARPGGGTVSPADAAVAAGEGEVLLGAAANSVGLDCLTGKTRFSGPAGSGELAQDGSSCITAGSTVHVAVTHETGGEWQVSFALGEIDGQPLAQCTLGPFPPDELYPAIQFCSIARSGLLAKGRSRSFSMLQSGGTDSSLTTSNQAKSPGAVVHLSYEPQTASDEESLRQLFHVIFNMVTHHYHEFHEHGLISNEALFWLTEAVEGAVDCAEGEVNRARAADFSRLQEMCRRPSSKSYLQQLSKELRVTRADSGRTYLTLFEPLVVEYLAVEHRCAMRSVFDRFPTWSLFRRLDYHRTLVKVESLWAFVEAHEVVLRKYTALERYPDLLKCLRVIVAEAKHDLKILADIKPRRYWYGKHFLALRVLMTKKRETLARFAQEGWLARDDCAHLNKSLRDRVQEVEYFIPKLYHALAGGHWARGRFRRARADSQQGPPTPADSQGALAAVASIAASARTSPGSVVPLPPPASPTSSAAQTTAATPTQRERLEAALGLHSPHSTEACMLPECLSLPGFAPSPEPCSAPPAPGWGADERIAALVGSTVTHCLEVAAAGAESPATPVNEVAVVVRRGGGGGPGARRPRPARLATPNLT